MKIGIIGLGRMGYGMAQMLLKNKIEVVVRNRSPEKVDSISKEGAIPSYSDEEFANKLGSPKIIWIMVPHETVDSILEGINPFLKEGDIVIDGGNSYYKESVRRESELKKKGVHFLDIGVSGGTVAAERGYCMMAGGPKEAYEKVEPFIKAMCRENGHGHMGSAGAGHFTKMVHNAIEYGIMESIGEGFDLIVNSPYKDADLKKIASVWNNGSIIESFLMEMTLNALKNHGNLEHIEGIIPDSGEGRWAVKEAIDNKVNFTANTYALMERFRSRQRSTFSDKLISVIRNELGGHEIAKK